MPSGRPPLICRDDPLAERHSRRAEGVGSHSGSPCAVAVRVPGSRKPQGGGFQVSNLNSCPRCLTASATGPTRFPHLTCRGSEGRGFRWIFSNQGRVQVPQPAYRTGCFSRRHRRALSWTLRRPGSEIRSSKHSPHMILRNTSGRTRRLPSAELTVADRCQARGRPAKRPSREAARLASDRRPSPRKPMRL
jgi:hypothetical protein